MSTYKATKFSLRSKSGSEAWYDYVNYIISEFATALTQTSASWSQQGLIETLGDSSSNSDYSLQSVQFKSSITNKYLRVWACTGRGNYGSVTVNFVTEPTSSPTTGRNLNMYTGNVLKANYTSGNLNYGYPDNKSLIFLFAVSSSSINVDFGLNLSLDLPIFSFVLGYRDATSGSQSFTLPPSFSGSVFPQSYTIITDGIMFSIMCRYSNSENSGGTIYYRQCFYAPDLIIPADPLDTYTSCVISADQNGYYFTFDENTKSDNYSHFCVLCTDSSGSYNFSGCKFPNYYINTYPAITSDSSNKLITVPMEIYGEPYYYPASTSGLMSAGVGFKGWVNQKYIRFANSTYVPANARGVTYKNGDFLCTGKSTLICWDINNPDPFV